MWTTTLCRPSLLCVLLGTLLLSGCTDFFSRDIQFVQVDRGNDHTCALSADSTAYCWGENTWGELGDGTSTSWDDPVPVAGGHTFTHVAAGEDVSCGLDQEGAAHCWGNNDHGQLGNGATDFERASKVSENSRDTRIDYDAEAQTEPVAVTGDQRFTQLSVHGTHVCGLSQTGRGFCWGNGEHGVLGNGKEISRGTPTPIALDAVLTQIDTHDEHTCATSRDGDVYCWGNNGNGELGDETLENSLTPVRVEKELSFAEVSAGANHSCALTEAGQAYCWGANDFGRLGDGSGTDHRVPVKVAGPTFTGIDAGRRHTCATSTKGAVYCWGYNQDKRFGSTTDGNALRPTEVKRSWAAEQIDVRDSRTYAVTQKGSVEHWGRQGPSEALMFILTTIFPLIPALVIGGMLLTIALTAERSPQELLADTAYSVLTKPRGFLPLALMVFSAPLLTWDIKTLLWVLKRGVFIGGFLVLCIALTYVYNPKRIGDLINLDVILKGPFRRSTEEKGEQEQGKSG